MKLDGLWLRLALVAVMPAASPVSSLLLLSWMAGGVSTARGEEAVLVVAGSRLRVGVVEPATSGPPSRTADLIGTLVGSDDETLALQPEGGEPPLRLPWSTVGSLEVSAGRHSARKAGGIIGAVLGAMVVGLLDDPCPENEWGCSETTERLSGAAWGALVYGFVGGAVGSFVKTEQWVPASPERLRIGLTPRADGIGVGLSVAF